MRSRRRRSSARSLPRIPTRPPGKTLAGDNSAPRQGPCRPPGQALTKGASKATSRPAPAKSPPPFACSCQPKPAGQAPAWQHAASRPTQHTPAWRHANLREGSTTAPSQLLACLHGAACIAGQGACQSEEEQRRTGRASPPSPIKLGDTSAAHLMRLVL